METHLLLLQLKHLDLGGGCGGLEGVAALLQHCVALLHVALVALQQLCDLLVLRLYASRLLKHVFFQVLVLLSVGGATYITMTSYYLTLFLLHLPA